METNKFIIHSFDFKNLEYRLTKRTNMFGSNPEHFSDESFYFTEKELQKYFPFAQQKVQQNSLRDKLEIVKVYETKHEDKKALSEHIKKITERGGYVLSNEKGVLEYGFKHEM